MMFVGQYFALVYEYFVWSVFTIDELVSAFDFLGTMYFHNNIDFKIERHYKVFLLYKT